MITQDSGEGLEVLGQMLLRQPVDGVLHGVGGEHALVDSHGVRLVDISLEQDLDIQVGEIVGRISAVDLGDSNVCLAPPVLTQSGHLSYPDRSCIRTR